MGVSVWGRFAELVIMTHQSFRHPIPASGRACNIQTTSPTLYQNIAFFRRVGKVGGEEGLQ